MRTVISYLLSGAAVLWAQVGHAQYIDMRDHGIVCNDSADDLSPRLAAAYAAALEQGVREIRVPACNLYFNTPPPAFAHGIRVVGLGKSFTTLNRNYTPASASAPMLVWNGSSGERGGALKDLGITTTGTIVGGIAVSIRASLGTQKPDYFEMERVFITGRGGDTCGVNASCWQQGLNVDGSLAPGGQGTSQGVRNFYGNDIYILTAQTMAATFHNVIHARIGLFTSAAYTGSTGAVNVTGGTDPRTDQSLSSLNVFLSGVIGNSLTVQRVNGFWGTGTASSLIIADTAMNVTYVGTPGTLQKSSSTACVMRTNPPSVC